MRKVLFLVLGLALMLPVAAQATILSGSFGISVNQGSGDGGSGAANNQANVANPLLGGTALYTGTYTGDIDFDDNGTNNVLAFLLSGGRFSQRSHGRSQHNDEHPLE